MLPLCIGKPISHEINKFVENKCFFSQLFFADEDCAIQLKAMPFICFWDLVTRIHFIFSFPRSTMNLYSHNEA